MPINQSRDLAYQVFMESICKALKIEPAVTLGHKREIARAMARITALYCEAQKIDWHFDKSGTLYRRAKPKKQSRDPILLAYQVLVESIRKAPKTKPPAKKDPAAVALGRKGGLARAAALPAKKRTQISAKGGKARWGKKG